MGITLKLKIKNNALLKTKNTELFEIKTKCVKKAYFVVAKYL